MYTVEIDCLRQRLALAPARTELNHNAISLTEGYTDA